MKYQPKVTIVIPVYNGSNFLSEAIDSALSQTYKNCEILVINDGSRDDGASEKIALSYGNRINYYIKKNGGVSSALNFAFERMTGEWFSWLSHDDLYYPQKIEKQIEFLNELIKEKPNLDLKKITVRCATESIDKDGKVIKTPSYRNVPKYEKSINTILNNIYNYRLSGCSFLLPTACIADVGTFAEDIRTVSDVEYWYRLLFAGYEFYCLTDDILVKNRSHGKQVGKTKVSLFDNELNSLHIMIADKIAQSNEYNNIVVMKRMYYGVVSRKMGSAAKYIKNHYITNNVLPIEKNLIIPIKAFVFQFRGTIINIARIMYRKVKVK